MGFRSHVRPVRGVVPSPPQRSVGFHPMVGIFPVAIGKNVVAQLQAAVVGENGRNLQQIGIPLMLVPDDCL